MTRILVITSLIWTVAITALHLQLNLNVNWFRSSQEAQAEDKFRIGYIPVT